jgi:formiminoglutamase
MEALKVYGESDIAGFTRIRKSEEKFGQFVEFTKTELWKDLEQSACRFVLLGIPEDIGVRANLGRAGAATAVRPAFDSFLNQQHNSLLSASTVFVLGELEVEDLMQAAEMLNQRHDADLQALRNLVAQIDKRLTEVIRRIVSLKKIPLVVGGGHNNAYGNIRGAAEAIGKGLHVINCDPHLDFRAREGRHSGNGFSYAFEEKFLERYAVLGMHEQYNNQTSIKEFQMQGDRLYYCSYERIFVRAQLSYSAALAQCLSFVRNSDCGVEIDLDAITNVPSSAKTSSGISPVEARQFAYRSGYELKASYFHVAEGAPVLSHIKADNKTGKLIAYLLSDFMKGVLDREANL